jgi:dephospho-CoA kinase
MTRGGLTLDEFLQRMELQWPDEDKVHLADFVIHNNSAEEHLAAEAKKIYNRLR